MKSKYTNLRILALFSALYNLMYVYKNLETVSITDE